MHACIQREIRRGEGTSEKEIKWQEAIEGDEGWSHDTDELRDTRGAHKETQERS